MPEDIVNQNRPPSESKDDRGGANLYPHPIIGIVKHNVDSARTGKIQVLLKRQNGAYPEDIPGNWTKVEYMSPFFGYTPNTSAKNDYGSYAGNPHSYGMWMTPPDLGTEVICIFINGDPNFGYYIGGVPKPGLNHMVPGIGAEDNVILNSEEAQSYGGATRLPVGEINNANTKQSNSSTLSKQPRPVHSYQAAIYNKQGLLRDPERGPISSSAQRESPSRVFGISTPGRPIYAGGYTDDTIKAAIDNPATPDKNLQITGRVGGHTFVMDDGDIEGHDQLVRIRTATGHTILMNDAAQTLFIMHANGQSYIELGKEGTIDMYATNSVNIRSQGDLNLHADRDVNINANRDLNILGVSTHIESQKNTTFFTGKAMNTTVLGTHTHKVGGSYSMLAQNHIGFNSLLGSIYLKGAPMIYLNSMICPVLPMSAPQLPRILHTDTLYDSKIGYAPAPQKLTSIVSRAPAHAPWASANKGVDVNTNLNAESSMPIAPSPELAQINANVGSAPENPTSPSLISTVPTSAVTTATESTNSIPSETAAAMVSQMAVTAATGPAGQAVQATAGVVETPTGLKASIGSLGVTPTQLAESGHLKPGADIAVNASIASGLGLKAAMPPNMFTGKDGINSVDDLAKNVPAQAGIAVNALNNAKTTLENVGAIDPRNSITQTAGMIMASAVAGPSKVLAYSTSVVGSATSTATSVVSTGTSVVTTATGAVAGVGSAWASLKAGNLTGISAGLQSSNQNLQSMGQNVQSAKDTFNSLSEAYNNYTSELGSSIDDLMKGGLFSSLSIEEKLNTSMVDNLIKSLKGAAQGFFDQVKLAFAPLQANVPISLTSKKATPEVEPEQPKTSEEASALLNKNSSQEASTLNSTMDAAKNTAVNTVQSETSTLATAVTGDAKVEGATSVPTSSNDKVMGGVPGGVSATATVVKNGASVVTTTPGIAPIATAVQNTAGAINRGAGAVVSGVQASVGVAGSALNLVNTIRSFAGLSALGGALGSISFPGGPFQTRAPIVAENTTNNTNQRVQAANLVGKGVPPPNFDGKTAKTPAEIEEENKKFTDIKTALAKRDEAFETWNTTRIAKGDNDSATVRAYAEYKAASDAADSLSA